MTDKKIKKLKHSSLAVEVCEGYDYGDPVLHINDVTGEEYVLTDCGWCWLKEVVKPAKGKLFGGFMMWPKDLFTNKNYDKPRRYKDEQKNTTK